MKIFGDTVTGRGLVLAILAAGVAAFACSKEVEPPKVNGPNEKLVSYKVTGMTCSGCETSLDKALVKLPNVREARASHKKERVWLVVTGTGPSDADVRDAVKKVGDQYEVAGTDGDAG